MRNRSFLVLVAIVAVVAAYILVFERHQASTSERQELANRIFPDFDESTIDQIRLHHGATDIDLVQNGDSWRLQAPIDFAADEAAVGNLLGALSKLEAIRRFPVEEVDPAQYGLDEPEITVTLSGNGSELYQLDLGQETPLGSNRALMVSDSEILICPGGFTSRLLTEVDDWRSKKVISVRQAEVTTIEIDSPQEKIAIARIADQWQMTRPVEDRADPRHMQQFVADLDSLRVEDWIMPDTDPVQLELAPPSYRLTVFSQQNEPTTLEFGVTRDENGITQIACRRNGRDLFWVRDTLITPLSKAGVRWRDPRVADFEAWAVASFDVEHGETGFSAARSDGLWQTGDQVLDGSAVQDFLRSLSELEARGFDLMAPATSELGRITLHVEDAPDKPIVITLYEPMTSGGRAMITSSDRATIMSLDVDDADQVLIAPDELLPPPSTPTPTGGS